MGAEPQLLFLHLLFLHRWEAAPPRSPHCLVTAPRSARRDREPLAGALRGRAKTNPPPAAALPVCRVHPGAAPGPDQPGRAPSPRGGGQRLHPPTRRHRLLPRAAPAGSGCRQRDGPWRGPRYNRGTDLRATHAPEQPLPHVAADPRQRHFGGARPASPTGCREKAWAGAGATAPDPAAMAGPPPGRLHKCSSPCTPRRRRRRGLRGSVPLQDGGAVPGLCPSRKEPPAPVTHPPGSSTASPGPRPALPPERLRGRPCRIPRARRSAPLPAPDRRGIPVSIPHGGIPYPRSRVRYPPRLDPAPPRPAPAPRRGPAPASPTAASRSTDSGAALRCGKVSGRPPEPVPAAKPYPGPAGAGAAAPARRGSSPWRGGEAQRAGPAEPSRAAPLPPARRGRTLGAPRPGPGCASRPAPRARAGGSGRAEDALPGLASPLPQTRAPAPGSWSSSRSQGGTPRPSPRPQACPAAHPCHAQHPPALRASLSSPTFWGLHPPFPLPTFHDVLVTCEVLALQQTPPDGPAARATASTAQISCPIPRHPKETLISVPEPHLGCS